MSQWYFNYQMEPEADWFPALAASRDDIVRDRKPPFTTILDVDKDLKKDSTQEEFAEARYRGPFYIDLDSDDPQQVVDQYKKLLRKLRNDYNVELDQLYLYATGGRGFHILIPQAVFMQKVNQRGLTYLPVMYKEMANAIFVDTLDLNIYSMKRGRQFRTVNVQRTNGRYKVPITLEESFSMTVESYVELTSAPRHVPNPAPPTFSQELGLLFATSNDKVVVAVKARKDSKVDTALLEAFGNELPPTLSAVMGGRHLKEGVGFQKIATQLAITATAIGMTKDTFITSCVDLINNHVGDGSRYGTPIKRKVELERMYDYMNGNPCYVFSVGAIKSMMEPGYKATDLDYGAAGVAEEASDDEMQFSVSQGINVTEQGIFKKVDGVIIKASSMGLANPKQLLDLYTGEVHGYEVDVFIDGRKIKTKTLGMDAFTSRAAFLKFTLSAVSCNINLTDAQIGATADIMRVRTEKNGKQVYTVRREGLDVIHLPDGRMDIVWADQYGVASNLGINYRLTGSMTEDLQFRTDLRQSPSLIDTPESQEFFDNLFKINSVSTVARVFGYNLVTFLSQPIRHLFGKFPFMQVFGTAGSGKTDTVTLMARVHYYQQDVMLLSALDATRFALEEMATCSGSVPFILDEYKPREMRKDLLEKSKGLIRSNFNGSMVGKGAVSQSTGQSKLTLTRVSNRSPIITIGEAVESQPAILERCVLVPMTKEGRKGRRKPFMHCQEHQHHLSGLGRIAIDKARGIDMAALRAEMNANIAEAREIVGGRADDADRPLFNIAVLLMGLSFGKHLLHSVFGDRYDQTIADMRNSVTVSADSLVPRIQSEASKVLGDIAHMSWNSDQDERFTLFVANDYIKDDAGGFVDINMKNAYAKYARYKRSTGEEVLYDSYDAFYSGMANYPGVMDRVSVDSILKLAPTIAVFRFSISHMLKEGVQEFK